MDNLYFKLAFCILIATLLALTSHIYVSQWTDPLIAKLTEGIQSSNHNYPSYIIIASYTTAFVNVGFLAFLYYHAGYLLPISNPLVKTVVLACILLEIKGNLFRLPIMDYLYNASLDGMQHPLTFVVLNQADKWISSLLLAASLVYLCPLKTPIKQE